MHDLGPVPSAKAAMTVADITLEAVPSASEVPAEAWDACANPSLEAVSEGAAVNSSLPGSKPGYNPFVSHAFFSAAENSGSAVARTGWGPRHLLARLDDKIAGIVP